MIRTKTLLARTIKTLEEVNPNFFAMRAFQDGVCFVDDNGERHCGTAHCIGGWMIAHADRADKTLYSASDMEKRLVRDLRLSQKDVDELFYMFRTMEEHQDALASVDVYTKYQILPWFDRTGTPEQRRDIALNVLRTLRDTGKVDWWSAGLATFVADEAIRQRGERETPEGLEDIRAGE